MTFFAFLVLIIFYFGLNFLGCSFICEQTGLPLGKAKFKKYMFFGIFLFVSHVFTTLINDVIGGED